MKRITFLIYAIGDTIAALLLGQFSVLRLVGISLVGATFYTWEIPPYFAWIEKRTAKIQGVKKGLIKAAWAMLYFNPLWIARHLLFIKIFSRQWADISWHLLEIGFWSFVANIPISLLANYLIQNAISLRWRFTASAIFSALMAIYYALSETLFGNLQI